MLLCDLFFLFPCFCFFTSLHSQPFQQPSGAKLETSLAFGSHRVETKINNTAMGGAMGGAMMQSLQPSHGTSGALGESGSAAACGPTFARPSSLGFN